MNLSHKTISDLDAQIEKECRFCNPPERERILFESENFYVMVSLGPIVEGYLLIVSKEHIGACFHLPKEYFDEFIRVKAKVQDILTKVYGGCIFYEHGKVGTSLTMGEDHRHCFHSHLHCIPVKLNLNNIIQQELEIIEFSCLKDTYDFVYKNDVRRYLLVEDETIGLYLPSESLQSQYLRYKLANQLGRQNDWDWVENQNWGLIDKSIERLKGEFV